jgi:PhnB protein
MSSEASTGSSTRVQISPMLAVRNGAKAVKFYQKAFGARILFRIGEGDEPVVAQLAVGDAEFWLADESPEYANFSPETLRGSSTHMLMIVDGPDSAFARELSAGAREVWPVEDQSYGWRVGRLVDPFGHHWEIGKPLT